MPPRNCSETAVPPRSTVAVPPLIRAPLTAAPEPMIRLPADSSVRSTAEPLPKSASVPPASTVVPVARPPASISYSPPL